ncbi:MAG: SH3 domain-containing protein, partial [Candidatus Promineifilaceae bacterium]
MLRQHPLLFFISLLFLATLACNAFAGEPEPAISVPPPAVTVVDGTAVPNTDTPITDIAPTATLPGGGGGTAVTNGSPFVTILVDLNIRSGPGVAYDRLGFFLKDSTAQVLGQDPASGWWLVACPSDVSAPQCWVSGGPQYTLASNVAGVPVAAVPPTPTPIPPATATSEPAADTAVIGDLGSYLVYSDTDGIWRLPLDTTQSPPTAGEPVLLAAITDVAQLLVSPNGEQIAFVTGSFESNQLGIVSATGGSQILVGSADLPEADTADFATLINQVAWLPNSQSLAFNTSIVNLIGPGGAPQPDLWLVTTSGSLTESFALGDGGHTFSLSPDGSRVIFGNPESVTRVNLDGSNRQVVIEFPFINTASEYAWVPTAQWLPSGSQAYVSIPDAEPWTAEAEAALYQIPVSGPAVEIGSVLGNTLFAAPEWARSGGNLGYTQVVLGPANVQSIVIADGDGDNPVTVRTANN